MVAIDMSAGPATFNREPPGTNRAQTATIGLILVFGMVLAGALLVVTFGSAAVEETQSGLSDQRAQKAMTQFDSKSALVALGNAETQSVDFPQRSGENLEVDKDAGIMSVRIERSSGAVMASKEWNLGRFTFESDGKTLAYQGGGVWRKSADSRESVMISPPEFHFRNGTLTLPIITVEGEADIREKVSVSHSNADTWFPENSGASVRTNPLDDHRVFVRVHSDYYKGWGRYFEERTDGEVSYNHADNNVTLELVTPLGRATVNNALAALSSGNLKIDGQAGTTCGEVVYVDSYNSSEPGGYCAQTPGNEKGNLTYGGDMDFNGGGSARDLKGSLTAGGKIDFSHRHWTVFDDINFKEHCMVEQFGTVDCRDPSVNSDILQYPGTDDVQAIPGVPEVPVLDGVIEGTVDRLADDSKNDNDQETGIDDASHTLDFSGGNTITLDGGNRYHLRNIHLDAQHLRLDVCSGPITVAVEGDVELREVSGVGSSIFVDDTACPNTENDVQIYVKGDPTHSDGDDLEFMLEKSGEVRVPDDDAPQFRIYGKQTFEGQVGQTGGASTYTGVIYAPVGGPDPDDGSVDIHKATVFGGIVTGDTLMNTQASLHYDEALKNKQIISRDSKVVKVTYLHVSKNHVVISD